MENKIYIYSKIQNTRVHLHHLITKTNSLSDPEILSVSTLLDTLLNQYEKVGKK